MAFLAVSPARMFSCISRLYSRVDSAASRKAKPCTLTWSRVPRASRPKTSNSSNALTEEHNRPEREFAAGGCFLRKHSSDEAAKPPGRESGQVQTQERGASIA